MKPPLALHSLLNTKNIVSSAAAATILARKDANAVLCVAGACANAALAKILKRAINQQRPHGATLHDPGMPSSHATALFYFASYLSLAATRAVALPVLVFADSRFLIATSAAPLLKIAAVALLLIGAALAAAKRVENGLHTPRQSIAGAVVGSLFGVCWYTLLQPRAEALLSAAGLDQWEVGAGLSLVAWALIVERRFFAAKIKEFKETRMASGGAE